LGEDVFTVGRPHPMIDGTLRREWILKAAQDPSTAIILLDIVLGYGAHPDPAGELLPALQQALRQARAAGRHLAVVGSVCGTEQDPQRRSAQVAALRAHGVVVMPSNAQAARLSARIAAGLARG
jgi:FdrA protein